MGAKQLWAYTKEYGKRHTFHMVMVVAFFIFGVLSFFQWTAIGSLYGMSSLNKSNITQNENDNITNREEDKQEFYNALREKEVEFIAQLEEAKMELNSKVDILDSAIKPEKKRRMVVSKIRDAIVENTITKLTIRDLNNIAIATLDYSYQYNLPVSKVLAQIKVESDFNSRAISHADARGLMQIIPETWDYIMLKEMDGKKMDIYSIYNNIRAGCFYMSEQVMKFDTYDEALMAYNWGPHRVRILKAGDITNEQIPNETVNYVIKINEWTVVFEKYGLEKYQ